MRRTCSRGLVLFLALVGCGCAMLAKKTPTPAARLDPEELKRATPPPNERYYLILFGSQDQTRRPAYTHTWGTLVRAVETPGCEPALDVQSISWMPTKLDINALSHRVEPGRNLDLHESLLNARRTNQEVAMWGPYEVSYPFTTRFLTQKAFLDSGAVGYQCIDTIGEAAREGNGCDCIHAISDMDPVYPRGRYPLAFYGIPATARLVRRIMESPVTIGAPATHDWLMPRLGLCQYPIERRQYRGKVEPYQPGTGGDLNAVHPVLRPAAPPEPKEPTPKTAPGPKDTPAAPAKLP